MRTRMTPLQKYHRALAKRIAAMLFTDGSGDVADRLAMEFPTWKDQPIRSCFGWSQMASRDRIEDELNGGRR